MSQNFDLVQLGDLIQIFDSKRVPLSSLERQKRKGQYPYYGAQGIIDQIDSYIFEGRYLLVPEDGENLRSRSQPIAYLADGKFWVNNHAHVIKGIEGISNDDYLMYAIANTDISPWVTGTAQPKLSQVNLKRIEVRLPPYQVQVAIAKILGNYDLLISNNANRINLLEGIARLIYDEWFVKLRFPGSDEVELVDSEVGEIPEGWRVSKLEQVTSTIFSGGTPDTRNPEYWSGTIPWLSSGETRARYIFGTEKRITQLGVDKSSTRLAKRGDVVVAAAGQGNTRGNVSFLVTDCYINQSLIAIRPFGEVIDPFYLLANLSSRYDELRGISDSNSSRGSLTTKLIAGLEILVPTPDVVTAFKILVNRIYESAILLSKVNSNLSETHDLLLPKLVSGDIDVSAFDATVSKVEP